MKKSDLVVNANEPPSREVTVLGHALPWVGGFLGIAAICLVSRRLQLDSRDSMGLVGSFGSSAAIVYGHPTTAAAQPGSVLVGQIVCALIGVTSYRLLASHPTIDAAVAVAAAMALMQLLGVSHPPGVATALVAVIGGPAIQQLGYTFVLVPVLSGTVVLLLVALVTNNALPDRRYPVTWW